MTHISIAPTELWDALDPGSRSNLPLASEHMQLLRLPHPRTGVPSLFLPHIANVASSAGRPSSSILEVQVIAPNSSRSWFLEGDEVIADGKLLMMTPVDPVFLLIPILHAVQPADGTDGNFRPIDDIFEEAASRLSQGTKASAVRSQNILQLATLDCVRDALKRICDFKDVTEEITVYRYSHSKLMRTISAKVARLSQPSVFDAYPSLQRQLAKDGLLEEGKGELQQSGRFRVACEVISQYLPPDVTSKLLASHDFTALDAHIQTLADDTNPLKPTCPAPTMKEDDNDNKKRKSTSQMSKGVSKLMKVNTTGMSKISTFFKKPVK